jgi:hypothetical protein
MLERPGFAYIGGINYLSLQVLDPFVFQLHAAMQAAALDASKDAQLKDKRIQHLERKVIDTLFWHIISFTHIQIRCTLRRTSDAAREASASRSCLHQSIRLVYTNSF